MYGKDKWALALSAQLRHSRAGPFPFFEASARHSLCRELTYSAVPVAVAAVGCANVANCEYDCSSAFCWCGELEMYIDSC